MGTEDKMKVDENMDYHPDEIGTVRASGKSWVRTLIVCAMIITIGIVGAS